ncbi:non-hydrolyzing UDP-N-acetylglucosamine 2-epimerase [Cellulosimicrobium cellulans]|uniref:non-hydrolyzing UDP-N-acetylglucosamine 2-epimerase n=1 Tax=Cellulosimicrobium cellulans TaxID=1710 RepID=UPI0009E95A62|nr:UDP-N-acetylglucosamine 2-epimerase (non-hydrolyzing) [Cellulosimicrobium cellulans]
MTVLHVVGARPNFPKMAPVFRGLGQGRIAQSIVHTGQHFDRNMSEVFFHDLGIPNPDLNLDIRGGSHAVQTAKAMMGLETAFSELAPSLVVVYGDVNSTLAAAVVAKKHNLPLVHVEAGLRSRDMTMPEEQNRVMVDAVADLLLCTSPDAVENLVAEGRPRSSTRLVGNTMIDSLFRVVEFGIRPPESGEKYAVATFHRPSNVDSTESARKVVAAVQAVAARMPLVLPLHPRSREPLNTLGLADIANVQVVAPMGYREFCRLVAGSRVVITDSGGIQEETTALGIPCLTMRANTERPVTITSGSNQLVDSASLNTVLDAVLADEWQPAGVPILWDGESGPRAAAAITHFLSEIR